jgi:hypothetical protein
MVQHAAQSRPAGLSLLLTTTAGQVGGWTRLGELMGDLLDEVWQGGTPHRKFLLLRGLTNLLTLERLQKVESPSPFPC